MKKKSNIVFIIIIIVMACVVAFCAYKFISIQLSYKEANDVYQEIEDIFNGEKDIEDVDIEYDDFDINSNSYKWKWIYRKLKAKYPDVIGYIQLKDVIAYPILQAEDNNKYLRNMINGDYNVAGSIFADCAFPGNMNEPYCIIYGHNMNDDSMFGSLKRYANKDWYDEHPMFDIYVGERHFKYYVFSAFIADAYGDVFSFRYNNNDEAFVDFADWLRSQCPYETKAPEIDARDKIVVLSTCVPNARATNYATRQIVCLVQGPEIIEEDDTEEETTTASISLTKENTKNTN